MANDWDDDALYCRQAPCFGSTECMQRHQGRSRLADVPTDFGRAGVSASVRLSVLMATMLKTRVFARRNDKSGRQGQALLD